MIAVADALHQRCRRCRTKLAAPTDNPRSAFCCKGCFRYFHQSKCLVCEESKSNPRRLICTRPKCKTEYDALRRHGMRGVFLELGSVANPGQGKSLAKSTPETGHQTAPTYRVVAGPALTAEQLRLAGVGAAKAHPVHPGLTANQYAAVLRDLEEGRISREAFDAWKARLPIPDNTTVIGRRDMPINIIGGYRPGARIELGGHAMSKQHSDSDEPRTLYELQCRRDQAKNETGVDTTSGVIPQLPPESPWHSDPVGQEPLIDRTEDR